MFRYLALSSAAVVGLLVVATAPAEAGRRTGTWKYWNPYMAQTAPHRWHKPHYSPYAGGGHGDHAYRGGSAPYGHAYGYRRHGPGW
jgi:hypothetical protein